MSLASPLYVLNIDPDSHRVTVGADAELATTTLARQPPQLDQHSRAHRAHAREDQDPPPPRARLATLSRVRRAVRAIFDEPQRAVTPGQSAVFYDGDEVVGGGWIV